MPEKEAKKLKKAPKYERPMPSPVTVQKLCELKLTAGQLGTVESKAWSRDGLESVERRDPSGVSSTPDAVNGSNEEVVVYGPLGHRIRV
jgi:hypothetical protein